LGGGVVIAVILVITFRGGMAEADEEELTNASSKHFTAIKILTDRAGLLLSRVRSQGQHDGPAPNVPPTQEQQVDTASLSAALYFVSYLTVGRESSLSGQDRDATYVGWY
jgi:hypothetical protein